MKSIICGKVKIFCFSFVGFIFNDSSDGDTGSEHCTIVCANFEFAKRYHACKHCFNNGFSRISVLLNAGEPIPCLSVGLNIFDINFSFNLVTFFCI